MSNASNDLVLHLKLDTIIPDADNQRVRSAFLSENVSALSESQYRIHGNPQVVPDEHFGSCFIFDGNNDYLELPRTNIPSGNEITVCFWANGGNNLPNTNSIVLAQTAKNSRILNINLPWSNKIIYFDCGGNPKDKDSGYDRIGKSVGTGQGTVQYKGKWNHWAFTKDATKGEMKIYLNGILWHYETGKKQTILPAAKVYIAKNYPGKIANFRTYKKALSPEEIKQDMNDDLTATAAFNLAYPLDFDLYEGDNKESIIFIENDAKGEELVFEIANNTEQGITLPAKSGAVSQNNYHFELRFRPDTLSLKSLQQLALKPQSNWSMSSPVSQPDGIVSLYFLTTNTTLPANQTFTLTLQNVSASAEGGARTTRVEFLCPEFTYQGETLTNYYREKNLSVIDHRGKKNIPLHVSFVESNRILNDGHTPNELTLRIVNVLKDKAIPLIPDSKGDKASKFIISFDVQEEGQNKDWALGTTSQVQGIGIQGKDFRLMARHIEEWKIVKETQGESPTWTITNQNEENVELRQEQGIELTISNIISSLPSGQTNLYLRYENIPGYWGGTFICTIEKMPILYKQGNVGIANNNPSNLLHIGQGESTITANRVGVVISTKGENTGIAIAQQGGKLGPVNLLVQAAGAGAYIGTTSAHSLVLRTQDTDQLAIDKDGNVWMRKNLRVTGIISGTNPIGGNAASIQGFGTGDNQGVFAFKYDKANFGDTPQAIQIWNSSSRVYKTFIIDHPLERDKYLVHATLEGPEGGVYYRGTARLNKGRSEVHLPHYFESLTCPTDRTITLTNINGFDRLAVEKVGGMKIKNGVFVVVSDNPESNQEFDWEVKAVRADIPRLNPEPEKQEIKVSGFGPYTFAVK